MIAPEYEFFRLKQRVLNLEECMVQMALVLATPVGERAVEMRKLTEMVTRMRSEALMAPPWEQS